MISTKIVNIALLLFAINSFSAFAEESEKPLSKGTQSASAIFGKMPTLNAETLSERKIVLPRELPGERTLVLIAFEQIQQKNVNTWIAGLDLLKSSIAWIETPVIDKPNAFVRAMINGGMRMGITDEKVRDRTVTLFTSRNEFVTAMKLKSGQSTIYAAVIDREGKVWAMAEGDYSADKAAPLLAALSMPVTTKEK
jgi:hypothetical protein